MTQQSTIVNPQTLPTAGRHDCQPNLRVVLNLIQDLIWAGLDEIADPARLTGGQPVGRASPEGQVCLLPTHALPRLQVSGPRLQ